MKAEKLEKGISLVGVALTSAGLAMVVSGISTWFFWTSTALLIIATLVSFFIK